jgi:hypothetical protein
MPLNFVQEWFGSLFQGIIEALYAVQRRAVKDALIIEDPTQMTGLGQGWEQSLVVFPYLLGMAIAFGIASAPFAKRYVPMEEFAMQFIKVILFVLLIGPLFSFGVELTNLLIDFMWLDDGVSQMQTDFNLVMGAMASSITLMVFAIMLGGLSWVIIAVFMLSLYLREYMVAATYVMSPILGPAIFFSWGPFKSVSRFPLILVRMSVYLLVVGVIIAGFVMTGAAASGAFAGMEDTDEISNIEGGTLEDVEITQADTDYIANNLDKFSEDTLERWAQNISDKSDEFSYGGPDDDPKTTVREYLNSISDVDLSDADIEADPLSINRAQYLCKVAVNAAGKGGFKKAVYDKGPGDKDPFIPPKESSWAQTAADFSASLTNGDGEVNIPSKQRMAEDCMTPLLLGESNEAIPPVTESDHGERNIVWISPLSIDDIEGRIGVKNDDIKKFVEENEQAIIEAEEEHLGSSELREEWLANNAHRGKIWVKKDSPGAKDHLWEAFTSSTPHIGLADQVLGGSEMGYDSDVKFAAIGMNVEGYAGVCEVDATEEEMNCYPNVEPVDAFNQFMYLVMSLVAPIVLIGYTGKAAFTPMAMLSKAGGGSSSMFSGRGKGDSSGGGSYNPTGDSGDDGSLGTRDELSVTETETDSDHHVHASESSIQGEFGDPESGPSPKQQPTPDDGPERDWSNALDNGVKRGMRGIKEAMRQGVSGGPVSWAAAGTRHLYENPVGMGMSDDDAQASALDADGVETASNSDILEEAFIKEQDEFEEENPVQNINNAEQVEQLDDGDVVNPEGTWTFIEDENSDYEQSGYFVSQDEEGNHHVMSYRTDQKDQAGLENGATYQINNGAVVRDNDGMDQKHRDSDFNAIEPGAQTQVTKVQDSELTDKWRYRNDTTAGPPEGELDETSDKYEINGRLNGQSQSADSGSRQSGGDRGDNPNSSSPTPISSQSGGKESSTPDTGQQEQPGFGSSETSVDNPEDSSAYDDMQSGGNSSGGPDPLNSATDNADNPDGTRDSSPATRTGDGSVDPDQSENTNTRDAVRFEDTETEETGTENGERDLEDLGDEDANNDPGSDSPLDS